MLAYSLACTHAGGDVPLGQVGSLTGLFELV